jgi:hypothetical protein
MVKPRALAVQHADNFVAHQKRQGELGPGRFCRAYVTGILPDVGSVDRLLLEGRGASKPFAQPQPDRVLSFVPADLRAHAQLLRFLIQQKDGRILQMEIVARDGQNPLQHLVWIKGGEHGLARIVKDCGFLHSERILPWRAGVTEVPKVTG